MSSLADSRRPAEWLRNNEPLIAAKQSTLTVDLKANEGRLLRNGFYATTDPGTGAVAGRLKHTGMQVGTGGALKVTRELTWDQRTIAGASIQRVRESIALAVAGDPTKAAVTLKQRTWQEDAQGQPTYAEATVKTTPPVVALEEHGSGEEEPHETVENPDSQPEWTKNAREIIGHNQYDIATGAKTRQIDDVDTSLMEHVPDGWVTPAGAGNALPR